MRYQREGTLLVYDLQALVYIDPNIIGDEQLKEEVDDDDMGVTKPFSTYW